MCACLLRRLASLWFPETKTVNNNKTLTHSLASLAMMLPLAASRAPSSSAADRDEPSLLVIKKRDGLSELDSPASVSVVQGDDLRHSTPQVNLSEALGSVPGLQIQNRQNYAQDLQLSVRGFGSRSTCSAASIIVRSPLRWFSACQ